MIKKLWSFYDPSPGQNFRKSHRNPSFFYSMQIKSFTTAYVDRMSILITFLIIFNRLYNHYLDVRVPWLQVDLEFSNPRVDPVICCRIYIFHCRICIFDGGFHNYYYIIRPKNHCYYKMKNYYHKKNPLLPQKKLSTTKFFSLSTTKKFFF